MAAAFNVDDKGFYVIGKTDPIEVDFELGKQIGQPGQFGLARIVTKRSNQSKYAVKVINKARFFSQRRYREKYIETFKREIMILKQLDHPNCIKLHEVYEDENDLYLVMDICSGGELFERIQKKGSYTEGDAVAVLRQIVNALKYLHHNKIAHCDLKPDNFLFLNESEDSVLKVIDFGMSKHVQRRQYHRQLCGTPYYIAPEVIDGKYNEACDMWSVGVVMFVMLFGFPPFWADPEKYGQMADEMIYRAIKKGFKPITKQGYGAFFPQDIPVSDSAKDLISKLLKSEIADRLTAEEALDHPWMKGEGLSSDPLPACVLASLTTFTKKNKFKQSVLLAMTNLLSEDQLNTVKEAFQKMDKNGDGTVNAAELKETLKDLSSSEVEILLSNVDINGDGMISYDELVAAAVQRKILAKEERLLAVFRSLDKNGDGKISVQELEEGLKKKNIEAAALIAEVDKNGDGEVDYEEFLQAWEDANDPAMQFQLPSTE